MVSSSVAGGDRQFALLVGGAAATIVLLLAAGIALAFERSGGNDGQAASIAIEAAPSFDPAPAVTEDDSTPDRSSPTPTPVATAAPPATTGPATASTTPPERPRTTPDGRRSAAAPSAKPQAKPQPKPPAPRFTTPNGAAAHAYSAALRGDRAGARLAATQDVATIMAAQVQSGWSLSGCDASGASRVCRWTFAHGRAQATARRTSAGSWMLVTFARYATVPQLHGQSEGNAVASLAQRGLKAEVRREPHDVLKRGLVDRTTPGASSEVLHGSVITVFVSDGPAPVTVTVSGELRVSDAGGTGTHAPRPIDHTVTLVPGASDRPVIEACFGADGLVLRLTLRWPAVGSAVEAFGEVVMNAHSSGCPGPSTAQDVDRINENVAVGGTASVSASLSSGATGATGQADLEISASRPG